MEEVFLDTNIVLRGIRAKYFGETLERATTIYTGVLLEMIHDSKLAGIVSTTTRKKTKEYLVSKIFEIIGCEPTSSMIKVADGVASKIMKRVYSPARCWTIADLTAEEIQTLPRHPKPHKKDALELLLAKKFGAPFVTLDTQILWLPSHLRAGINVYHPIDFFEREEFHLPGSVFHEYRQKFLKDCEKSSLKNRQEPSLKVDSDMRTMVMVFKQLNKMRSITGRLPKSKILLQPVA